MTRRELDLDAKLWTVPANRMKARRVHRVPLASQAETKTACFSYIEGWYNPVRLHSGLGYRSPMTYEANRQTAEAHTWIPSPQTVHEIGSTPNGVNQPDP